MNNSVFLNFLFFTLFFLYSEFSLVIIVCLNYIALSNFWNKWNASRMLTGLIIQYRRNVRVLKVYEARQLYFTSRKYLFEKYSSPPSVVEWQAPNCDCYTGGVMMVGVRCVWQVYSRSVKSQLNKLTI